MPNANAFFFLDPFKFCANQSEDDYLITKPYDDHFKSTVGGGATLLILIPIKTYYRYTYILKAEGVIGFTRFKYKIGRKWLLHSY